MPNGGHRYPRSMRGLEKMFEELERLFGLEKEIPRLRFRSDQKERVNRVREEVSSQVTRFGKQGHPDQEVGRTIAYGAKLLDEMTLHTEKFFEDCLSDFLRRMQSIDKIHPRTLNSGLSQIENLQDRLRDQIADMIRCDVFEVAKTYKEFDTLLSSLEKSAKAAVENERIQAEYREEVAAAERLAQRLRALSFA